MVLHGEFYVQPFHHGSRFAAYSRLLTKSYLPVRKQSLHEEVEAYQKVHNVIVSSLTKLRGWDRLITICSSSESMTHQTPSKHGDFQDLTRELTE